MQKSTQSASLRQKFWRVAVGLRLGLSSSLLWIDAEEMRDTIIDRHSALNDMCTRLSPQHMLEPAGWKVVYGVSVVPLQIISDR